MIELDDDANKYRHGRQQDPVFLASIVVYVSASDRKYFHSIEDVVRYIRHMWQLSERDQS